MDAAESGQGGMPRRWLIIGGGAVGCTLAAELVRVGRTVTVVEREPEHRSVLQERGLELRRPEGRERLRLDVVGSVAEAAPRAGDAAVLAVKTWDTETACAELHAAAGGATAGTVPWLPLLCAQNGVRNEAIAARLFRDVGGLVLVFNVARLEPGVVRVLPGGRSHAGAHTPGAAPTVAAAVSAFAATRIPLDATGDLERRRWNKLVLNLNNATFGLLGLSSQEGRALPEAQALMIEVFAEGIRVLRAAGIPFEDGPEGALEGRLRLLSASEDAPQAPVDDGLLSYPSLWQDLWHRRGRTEAPDLNGEIVRLGVLHGVPTPLSSALLSAVTAAADERRGPGTHTLAGLAQLLGLDLSSPAPPPTPPR